MSFENLDDLVHEFCSQTHGASDYYKDEIFIKGRDNTQYAPFKFLIKKNENLKKISDLFEQQYVYTSYDFSEKPEFKKWYEVQFSRKLSIKRSKEIFIVHKPDQAKIFNILEQLNESYEALREQQILLNGKNLPVQVGEWFAKCIFGLKQKRSTSQRGFDFLINNNMVEVKVHWKDLSSPKGVKVKKSLIDLSDFCVIIYLTKNFLIRDICLLDSDFIMRKFAGKGHTIFLKDPDINAYFFSKSSKHFEKIVDRSSLMKFASPGFAMKLDGRL